MRERGSEENGREWREVEEKRWEKWRARAPDGLEIEFEGSESWRWEGGLAWENFKISTEGNEKIEENKQKIKKKKKKTFMANSITKEVN